MQSYGRNVGRNETVYLLYLLRSCGTFFSCHSSLQQGHLKVAGLGETWSCFSLYELQKSSVSFGTSFILEIPL